MLPGHFGSILAAFDILFYWTSVKVVIVLFCPLSHSMFCINFFFHLSPPTFFSPLYYILIFVFSHGPLELSDPSDTLCHAVLKQRSSTQTSFDKKRKICILQYPFIISFHVLILKVFFLLLLTQIYSHYLIESPFSCCRALEHNSNRTYNIILDYIYICIMCQSL